MKTSRAFPVSLMALAWLTGCQSPMRSIASDIEKFKQENASHLGTYQGADRKMHFAWSGDPTLRPIIFVHGSPGSWEAWAHFLRDENLQKKYHLLAVDRPGYGGSGPLEAEASLAKQSENIIDVLKMNKSGMPAFVIGHSFGGAVIAKMAMDYPDRVAGLIFVASSVSPDLEKTKWIQYPATWWPFREFLPSAIRVCNEEILPLKAELEKIRADWSRIQAPTVSIQGQDDDLVPPGNQDFIVKNLNPEMLVKSYRIPGLNHFIPWKRPDLIIDGIQAVDGRALSAGL